MKKVLILLFIIGLIGGGYAYYEYSRTIPKIEESEADFEMTADELFNAFESNETDALKKYEGKIIKLSGEIIEIKKSEKGSNITLNADNALFGGVNCSFDELNEELEEGNQIVLIGRCQGFLMNVIINNTSIINISGGKEV